MPDQPAANDVTPDAAGPHIDGGDIRTVLRSFLWELRWWTRWWLLYFIPSAVRRLRRCRSGGHHGPLYDGVGPCLYCLAPWFGEAPVLTQKSPPHSRREARE